MVKIKTIPITAIKPAAYNPRKDLQPGDPEYEKLKKSIIEFDLVEPLVWNQRSGNLVGGHQRLKILKELGIENIEVSVVDLSDAKEKALNLALNKISGEWDFPLLKDVLLEIDTGDFDMEITGFETKEIEDLMSQFHVPEEGQTDDDAVPEEVETVCKTGDLWQLGDHRLLCGDATKKEDVDKLMGGEKADMVFTDPPYGIGIIKNKGTIGGDRIGKSQVYRAIIGDDKPFDPSYILNFGIPTILWGANYYADKLPCKAGWIIWDKRAETTLHRTFADVELAWSSFDKPARIYRHLWDGAVRAGNRKEELSKRVHPTQKPIGLFVAILQEYDVTSILDLFGGSGSTLIACEKLRRRCFMMEIDEHYCDVIITRWQDFTGKQAVKIG